MINNYEAVLFEQLCLFFFSKDLVEDGREIPPKPKHLNDVHFFSQGLTRPMHSHLLFITLATDNFFRQASHEKLYCVKEAGHLELYWLTIWIIWILLHVELGSQKVVEMLVVDDRENPSDHYEEHLNESTDV